MWRPRNRLGGGPALLVLPFFAAGLAVAAAPPFAYAHHPAGQQATVERKPPLAPLLPDMVALRAQSMTIEQVNGHRRLRFAAALGNVGRGPMEVRPNNARHCPPHTRHASQIIYHDVDGNHHFRRDVDTTISRRSAGCMVFHPQHDHWHFEAAARYLLYRPNHRHHVLLKARKTSFCLRDSERVPAHFGTFHAPPYYGDCSRDTPQGITSGWADLYEAFLAGQSLDLPNGLPDHVYCLGVRVDPRDELRESDETNNLSARAIRIDGDHVSPAHTDVCNVHHSTPKL
jgi:Lysyl oxidase